MLEEYTYYVSEEVVETNHFLRMALTLLDI